MVIVAAVIFEKGNAAPTGGRIPMVAGVFLGTAVTMKSISICWLLVMESRLVPAPASFAVNVVMVAESPGRRITGAVSGVEKATLSPVRSIGDAPGARPIKNLISSIPEKDLRQVRTRFLSAAGLRLTVQHFFGWFSGFSGS